MCKKNKTDIDDKDVKTKLMLLVHGGNVNKHMG